MKRAVDRRSSPGVVGDATRGSLVVLPITSDAAIVAAVRAGRPEGAVALYQRYAPFVRRMLTRVLGPDAAIRDLEQDVFLAAIDGMDRLQEEDALRGWLAGICVRLSRAEIRRRTRDRWFPRFAADDPPETEAPSSDPEVDAAARATYRILGKLGADDRIVFALRYLDGMDLVEVADACGVSLATIKRHLARARHRFMTMARSEPELADWVEGGKP